MLAALEELRRDHADALLKIVELQRRAEDPGNTFEPCSSQSLNFSPSRKTAKNFFGRAR